MNLRCSDIAMINLIYTILCSDTRKTRNKKFNTDEKREQVKCPL